VGETFTEESIGKFYEVIHDPRLTSSEISYLWRTCMFYSTLRCVFKHFISKVEDRDILALFEHILNVFDTRISAATDYLKKDGHPVPKGFGDEDVDISAPRLYSDLYYLYYTKTMTPIGLNSNSLALSAAARTDIREFYTECLVSTARISNRAADILLSKGLYIRPPYITTNNERDFVKEQNFLRGFLGKHRPLLAAEIDQLFTSSINNLLGKALLTGFRQVARSEQIRSYISRGIEIAGKQVEIFSSILKKEDIHAPAHWDTFVTDSTTPPFSDKLMMYHVVLLSSLGIGNSANSMASSLRHDLTATYARLMVEASNFAEDGVNIMIDNGWFEEPPRTVDRRDLVNTPTH
jgi:hypothetical protein